MDLFKTLKDLEFRALGVDPINPSSLPEGFFVSFRQIGLPINERDYTVDKVKIANTVKDIAEIYQTVNKVEIPADQQLDTMEGKIEDINTEIANQGEAALYNTFQLTNEKIRLNSSYSVEPGTQKIHSTWEGILNGATIDLRDIDTEDALSKKFKEFSDKYLTEEMIEEERELMSIIEEEEEEMEEAYAELVAEGKLRLWRTRGKRYARRLQRARNMYRIKTRDYRQAMAILDAEGIDPAAFLISRAKSLYESHKIAVGANALMIPHTTIVPSDWASTRSRGWITYDESSYKETYSSKGSKIEAGGGLGLNFGFWSIGANGGYTSKKETMDLDSEGMSIHFEYKLAKIQRPWMDTSILRAQNWYLKSNTAQIYSEGCISDGTFGQEFEDQRNIFLPSVITSLILVKDIEIEWKRDSVHYDAISKEIKGGATVGIGPFRFGGSYGKTNESKNYELDGDERKLTIDGIQLIGYVSEILPKSPLVSSPDRDNG